MSEKILKMLREHQRSLTPSKMADLLEELLEKPLTQDALVFTFKKAFAEIPLRAILEASGWARVCQGGFDDEEFDRILGPWLGGDEHERPEQGK